MNYLSQQFQKIASWKTAVFSLALMLGCLAIIASPWSPAETLRELAKGLDIPDAQPLRTSAALYGQLNAYGAEGIHLYLAKISLVDCFIPIAQALFLAIVISLVLRNLVASNSKLLWLNLIPVVALLGDYAENLSLIVIMQSYPKPLVWLADLAMYFTLTKFVFSLLSLAIILLSLLILGAKSLTGSSAATA